MLDNYNTLIYAMEKHIVDKLTMCFCLLKALNFMYIYADKFPDLKWDVKNKQKNYPNIEMQYQRALDKAWHEFTSFVGRSNV